MRIAKDKNYDLTIIKKGKQKEEMNMKRRENILTLEKIVRRRRS